MSGVSFREYSSPYIRRMRVDWPAMEGYGRGTDPIVLLGWRVEYLACFSIPINLVYNLKFEIYVPFYFHVYIKFMGINV